MLVSFHSGEASPDLQVPQPDAARPESLPSSTYAPPGSNPDVRAPFDIRYTDDAPVSDDPAPAQQKVWFRTREELPDRPVVHACALAYATDLTLTRTSHMPLRAFASRRLGSSLDHSMWFHRALRMDDWLLFVQEGTTYSGSRSLSLGQVFDRQGRFVATATQEALIRMDSPAAPGAGPVS